MDQHGSVGYRRHPLAAGLDHSDRTLHRIAVTNPGSANPTFTVVSSQTAPSATEVDGIPWDDRAGAGEFSAPPELSDALDPCVPDQELARLEDLLERPRCSAAHSYRRRTPPGRSSTCCCPGSSPSTWSRRGTGCWTPPAHRSLRGASPSTPCRPPGPQQPHPSGVLQVEQPGSRPTRDSLRPARAGNGGTGTHRRRPRPSGRRPVAGPVRGVRRHRRTVPRTQRRHARADQHRRPPRACGRAIADRGFDARHTARKAALCAVARAFRSPRR